MLWLALCFPELAIECLPGAQAATAPWLLSAHNRVVACNAPARALGVQVGQGLNAAFALAPEALQAPYDPTQPAQALRELAERLRAFSAEVSLEGLDTLLIEVGSALRYFGGLAALRAQLHHALAEPPSHVFLEAAAPTPQAALWLVRAAPGTVIEQPAELLPALAALPLEASGIPAATCAGLRGVGIERIGQAMALAPEALAQRFGPGLRDLFDRALGRQPDPRLSLAPEQGFRREVELPAPLLEWARLMPIIEHLLPELLDWCWRTARVLTRIGLTLCHDRPPATCLEIGFAGTRNPAHLRLVIEERLQTLTLPSAVEAIILEILSAEAAPAASGELLPAPPSRLREGQELLERLRARLGKEAVRGLTERADHRPEHAWGFVEPGSRSASALAPPDTAGGLASGSHPPGPRPLWLLERPRDLGNGVLPRLGGPLQLLTGPERIEAGWWDGSDIARDYFVAAGPEGPQYWVYRERRGEARWFLQGLFA